MRAPLTTAFLTAAEWDAWATLANESPHGSVYCLPAYLAALCDAAGGSFRVLAAKRGEELLGGVAMYERHVGGSMRVAPRPLMYYNGLVLREPPSKYPSQRTARVLEVTTALEQALGSAGYEAITLKSRSTFTDARVFMANGWAVRPGYTYVVSIADTALAWDRVEQNLRRLVKRCTDEGLQLTEDDDFESFHRMHADTAQRKDTPQYLPRAGFERFFATLRAAGLCRLYHARLRDGKSIAAQLVLTGKGPVTHSVAAGTDPAYLNLGATAFLRWRVFEALSALGYTANDLTDAALNPVAHFKSQLGGNLEMCLIVERAQAPAGWRQRVKALMSKPA